MTLPRYRGSPGRAVQPGTSPAVKMCHLKQCEAGGWILERAPRDEDEEGRTYHPGCMAKERWTRACE